MPRTSECAAAGRELYIPFVPRQSGCFGSKRRAGTNHCDGSSPLFCRMRESRCPKGGSTFLASGGYKRYNTLDLASKIVCRGHLRFPRLLPGKGSAAPSELPRQQAAARTYWMTRSPKESVALLWKQAVFSSLAARTDRKLNQKIQLRKE